MENILALDIGSNSVGWAYLSYDKTQNTGNIIQSGVKIFSAGKDIDGKTGRESSFAAQRSAKRRVRRQKKRKNERKRKVWQILTEIGIIKNIDFSNRAKHLTEVLKYELQYREEPEIECKFLYVLRKEALERELNTNELLLVLYSFTQRRGFLSNRKSDSKEGDEEKGVIKKSIESLTNILNESNSTLGAFYASENPHVNKIRGRYTHRDMYKCELNKILEFQKQFKPNVFTDKSNKLLKREMFYQRPLKSCRNLIGKCTLFSQKRRMRKVFPSYQKFIILSNLSNIVIYSDNNRKLTTKEISVLFQPLFNGEDLKPKTALKLLGLPETTLWNVTQQEDLLKLNKISKKIKELHPNWNMLSFNTQEEIVNELVKYENYEPLKKRLIEYYKIEEKHAHELANYNLPDLGFGNYSSCAITQLNTLLESGLNLYEAESKLLVKNNCINNNTEGVLSVKEVFGELKNPFVERCLTEVRKLVNAVVKKYGKPTKIKIELARDVKQSTKNREDTRIEQQQLRRVRESSVEWLESKGFPANGKNIELHMLYTECGGICPYTGKTIEPSSLFSGNSSFDIEHIIPYSRSFDDSYANKTLCCLAIKEFSASDSVTAVA